MPWLFDNPVSTGGLDNTAPNNAYTHCRVRMRDNDPDARSIILLLEFGYMDGADFVKGALLPVGVDPSPVISGDSWVALVTTHTPNPGEKTYQAAKRGLYEFLVASGAIGPGQVT